MRKGPKIKFIVLLPVLMALVFSGSVWACLYDQCYSTTYGAFHTNSITINEEEHGYSFEADAGDIVFARLVHTDNTFSPLLTLVSPFGFVVASNGIPGTGIAEIISPPLGSDGNYTFVVSDFAGNGKGKYYLSVQSVNHPANVRFLNYDGMIKDTLVRYSEINMYQFVSKAGEMATIQMIASDDAVDPQIRLYGPDGRLYGSNTDNTYAVISNRILPDSGRYTVIATDFGGNDLGEYFLIILRGPTDVDDSRSGLPVDFFLDQNCPNPFNPQTTISYGLLRSSEVRIEVYNILGRNIRTLVSGQQPAGRHSVVWDGRDENGEEVSSGIYFYRLVGDDFSESRKMLLLR